MFNDSISTTEMFCFCFKMFQHKMKFSASYRYLNDVSVNFCDFLHIKPLLKRGLL